MGRYPFTQNKTMKLETLHERELARDRADAEQRVLANTRTHDVADILLSLKALMDQASGIRESESVIGAEGVSRRLAVIKAERARLWVRLSDLVIRHAATLPGFTFEHDGERVLSIEPVQGSLL